MTAAVICVPWRAGSAHRERSWIFARRRWARLGLEIVVGDRPGPFSRSGSRNAAAAAAGAWDVAVFVDADTIVREAAPTLAAIELAAASGRVVIPHDQYLG